MNYDVCIIGSGIAGLAAYKELTKNNLNVCLFESGYNSKSANIFNSYKVKNKKNHFESKETNLNIFGGNSSLWAGRCHKFDPLDFKKRLKSFLAGL